MRAAALPSIAGAVLGAVALGLAAVGVGLWLALTGLWGALPLLGVAALAAALMLPWRWLWWGSVAVVMAAVGPLQYMAGLSKAYWLPYGLALLWWLRLLSDARQVAPVGPASPTHGVDAARRWAVGGAAVFAATAVLASALRLIPPAQWLVAGKEYLWLACVPLAFHRGALGAADVQRVLRWAPAWLLVQAGVAAWQRVWVAPRRGDDAPWDAVVGLFGGQPTTGGGSGAMVLVTLCVAAWVLRAARAGQLGGGAAGAGAVAALFTCALAEVKLALLMLPLLAVAVAWPLPPNGRTVAGAARGAPRRARAGWLTPAAVLGAVLVALSLSAALAWAYQQQYAGRGSREGQSLSAYAEAVIQRNQDTALGADAYGQLSRLGALRHWWVQQQAGDLAGWLVGHGMGASRRGQWAVGDLARQAPFRLARSSAALLLWEVGVLGLAGLTVAGVCAAGAALRRAVQNPASGEGTSATPPDPSRVWWPVVAAGFVLAVFTLPYGTELFETPQWPWLLGVMAGLLVMPTAVPVAGGVRA